MAVKGMAQKGPPQWRDDDKDGHFMFALGENLTSHCNYTCRCFTFINSVYCACLQYLICGSIFIILIII